MAEKAAISQLEGYAPELAPVSINIDLTDNEGRPFTALSVTIAPELAQEYPDFVQIDLEAILERMNGNSKKFGIITPVYEGQKSERDDLKQMRTEWLEEMIERKKALKIKRKQEQGNNGSGNVAALTRQVEQLQSELRNGGEVQQAQLDVLADLTSAIQDMKQSPDDELEAAAGLPDIEHG